MSRGLATVLLALAVAVAAGCGGDDGSGGQAPLDGTSWVLTAGVTLPQDAVVTMPTAEFTATEISGSTGCNRYGGSYALEGDEIDLGPLGMTQVGCAAPASTIEAAFVAALDDVETWELDGDELVLGDDGVELLRFAPTVAS